MFIGSQKSYKVTQKTVLLLFCLNRKSAMNIISFERHFGTNLHLKETTLKYTGTNKQIILWTNMISKYKGCVPHAGWTLFCLAYILLYKKLKAKNEKIWHYLHCLLYLSSHRQSTGGKLRPLPFDQACSLQFVFVLLIMCPS